MMELKRRLRGTIHKSGFAIKRLIPRPSTLFIKKFYKDKKEGLVGAEVGVYRGENAKSILKTLPIKKLYLIDPYIPYKDFNSRELEKSKRKILNVIRKSDNRAVLVMKTSTEAVSEIPDNLDFVYIDGDHSYKHAKEDMINYYKKLKSGGVLAGHDIENGIDLNDGVTKAFVEFVNEKKLKPYILFPDWWVVKS